MTINLDSKTWMFVDEKLIDKCIIASLKLNKPEKKEVVLRIDQDCEDNVSAYHNLVDDGIKIRMYYRGVYGVGDHDKDQVTCYAESTDGINFTKPELNIFEYNGTTKNNIIWKGYQSTNFMVFYDKNPNCKHDERFKAVGGVPPEGLSAFVSSDGIHWKKMVEEPIMTKGAFDSLNVVFWDTNINKYRCFSRYFDDGSDTGKKYKDGAVRAIQNSVSDDFINWSTPVKHKYDVELEHFYTNATVQCPDAEHYYLSFPKRFVWNRQKLPEHPYKGISDAMFMTSIDGEHWDRTFREAWIRPGMDQRNWGERSTMTARGIIMRNDEFYMYVSENVRFDTNRLRRYSIGKHRFASIHADYKEGTVITKPLTFTGENLYLNYSTSAAGYIKVAIADEDGKIINGFEETKEIFGDKISESIKWDKDISILNDKIVRFIFKLQDADIYSITVK